jgi:predicted DNA-binding transcriptional regulator YafY
MMREGATLRNQLRRLRQIRATLAEGPASIDLLAERFAVSVRTIRRDLNLLREEFCAPIAKGKRGQIGNVELTAPWDAAEL